MHILALDQGTTSSRAIIFDRKGNTVASAKKEFRQVYPRPGWVEHHPQDIWSTQAGVAAEALSRGTFRIAAIGITNQRETTLVWRRDTGEPIYNAIVWQDRRTADFCHALKVQGFEPLIHQKTGLLIDAYFSGSKIKWILDHVDGARDLAKQGKLAFGTVDSWLLWQLTQGKRHYTDVSNASRTLLFNIHTLDWDDELLRLLDIPRSLLPEVKTSSEIYDYAKTILDSTRIPIGGMTGDQQAALFGQLCTQAGMVKNTYGTGCFIVMNTGRTPILSRNNLLSTVAWKIHDTVTYALEGSIFMGGAIVQWLRDGLGIIKTASEIETLAATVDDSNGVYIVPAFTGLGAPHWEPHARGTIFGLTRGTSAAHIARAALDSIAYQTFDIVKAMESDSHMPIQELRVDGGATVNNLLMQFQADMLGVNVIRPKIIETTALGAAYLAGLAVGYWEDIEDIRAQWQLSKRFRPACTPGDIDARLHQWHRAIHATKTWAQSP